MKSIYKLLLVGALASATSFGAFAQEEVVKDTLTIMQEQIDANASSIKKTQKLKVSGYVQTQLEVSGKDGSTKTGANGGKYSSAIDGKDADWMTRYGVRRGRIKFEYTEGIGKAVFQLDVVEDGVKFKDAYFEVSDKWLKMFSLKAGIFDRQFGDEITYSSSRRETPERTMMFQKLFPDERDLGVNLNIKAPKGHALEGLKLDVGLYSGNGIRKDDNSKMDFIGHLKYDRKSANIAYGVGVSYYNGATNNADTLLYNIVDGVWKKEAVEANQTNKREYFGVDAQFTIETILGLTNLRGEYVFGSQPSVKGDFGSPKSNTYDASSPFNYMRKFSGGHIYLVQDIYRTPLSLVIKYAYLDPNTEVKGDEVKNKTDIAYNHLNTGLLWKVTKDFRVMADYQFAFNETSEQLTGFKSVDKRKEDIFTLRLQYKF